MSDADILAEVRFLANRRFRATPHFMGLPFEFEGERFDCRVDIGGLVSVSPETAVIVPISFLHPEFIKPRLRLGAQFTLWEMGAIAEGVVKEILS